MNRINDIALQLFRMRKELTKIKCRLNEPRSKLSESTTIVPDRRVFRRPAGKIDAKQKFTCAL